MKKILCLLSVLTLFVFALSAQSTVESVEEPANEEPVTYCAYIGYWIISDESITEMVKNELIKEGINKNSDLFSFYLSNGVNAFKSELPDILLTLESDNKGKYAIDDIECAVTYQITEAKRLFLTAKDPGGLSEEEETAFYGTFNDDYSKLYPSGGEGIYLVKREK